LEPVSKEDLATFAVEPLPTQVQDVPKKRTRVGPSPSEYIDIDAINISVQPNPPNAVTSPEITNIPPPPIPAVNTAATAAPDRTTSRDSRPPSPTPTIAEPSSVAPVKSSNIHNVSISHPSSNDPANSLYDAALDYVKK
jgi:hypothetical protein